MARRTRGVGFEAVGSVHALAPRPGAGWGRRVTVGAFWFFLVKGLAWLAVPAVAAYYANA